MVHGNIKDKLEHHKISRAITTPPRSPLLDSKWETMYASLLKYKEEKGDTLVPNRYPKLGSWVSTQRRYYKESMLGKETPLTPKRIQMLQDVGFVWEAKKPNHVPWETRYQELVEYQSRHGHCLVPINYSENIQLAIWVSTQRQEYKLWCARRPCRITSHQIQLLQNIGFSFEPPRGGSRVRKRRRESTASMDSKCSAVEGPRNNQIKTPFIPKGTTEQGQNQLNSDATTPWIKLFKEYIWYKDSGKDIYENASLKRWCQQQKEELKRWEDNPMLSKLNQEHVNLLKSADFDWEDESQRIIHADKNIDSKAAHDDG
jgi:Helicase associated domain.